MELYKNKKTNRMVKMIFLFLVLGEKKREKEVK